MTVPPYAVAYVVTLAVAWSADHFNRYFPLIHSYLLLLTIIAAAVFIRLFSH